MDKQPQTTNTGTEQFWELLKSVSKQEREKYFSEHRTQGFASQIELAWRQAHPND